MRYRDMRNRVVPYYRDQLLSPISILKGAGIALLFWVLLNLLLPRA